MSSSASGGTGAVFFIAGVEHAQDRRALGFGNGVASGLGEERFALVDRADQRVDGLEFNWHSAQ